MRFHIAASSCCSFLLLSSASSFGTTQPLFGSGRWRTSSSDDSRSRSITKTTTTTTTTIPTRALPTIASTRRPLSSSSWPFVVRGGGDGGTSQGPRTSAAAGRRVATGATVSSSSTSEAIGSILDEANLALLSERGRKAVENLVAHDIDYGAQRHVYADWPPAGTDDEGKRRLAEQLADLDASYPGGLPAYLEKAKKLLEESATGVNPFEDYEAVVPAGESLQYCDESNDDDSSSMSFAEAEGKGLEACAGAAFVLVAGGLGERLGYSGIKLELETNLCTNKCYLEVYVRYIQALEHLARERTGRTDLRIPLVIMTSGDTDAKTRELLENNDYFGMDRDMLTLVVQDKVAALKDGTAGLALQDDDRWTVQTKPHGHGDVHHLLHKFGLVEKWRSEGRTHVIFLQDTNALVINSVIPTLGVSVAKGFIMNSICIPRLAGEAAGAIARLEHRKDPSKSLVINVEYNQLDPLLRSQGDGQGDVPDPSTGYSPFPGNANNLVIELNAYAKTLAGEDQGVVLEFVNPKYKDESRTDFKKPTRLECMMQDIPKLFQKELGQAATENIGFTMFDRWFTFSPAKNALSAGQDAVAVGSTAPGTMSSAESDKYVQNQYKLRHAGVQIRVSDRYKDLVPFAGIPVTAGPRIILCPAFAVSQRQIAQKIRPSDEGGGGDDDAMIRISDRSSLVLDGHHLVVESLDLDGALVIRSGPDTHLTVRGLVVRNDGWQLRELDDDDEEYPERVRIRGYTMDKRDSAEYVLNDPGHFVLDGSGRIQKIDK